MNHPIITEFKDTEIAEIMGTDEIYLFKSASMINYLYNLIEENNFHKGLELLMNKFQRENIDYKDFFEIYETNFRKNIHTISKNILKSNQSNLMSLTENNEKEDSFRCLFEIGGITKIELVILTI